MFGNNYYYTNTMSINTTIEANNYEKNITLSTKYYQKYMIKNVIGSTFQSWYNISEKIGNNKITVGTLEKFDVSNYEPGVMVYEEVAGSPEWLISPVEYGDTMLSFANNLITGDLVYIDYVKSHDDIIYFDGSDNKYPIGIDEDKYIQQTEHLILDYQNYNYYTQFITSLLSNPKKISNLIINEIGAWSNKKRVLWCNKQNIFLKNNTKTSPQTPFDPKPRDTFGYISGYTTTNCASDVTKQSYVGANWFIVGNFEVNDKFYNFNIDFQTPSEINVDYSFMSCYDKDGKFLFRQFSNFDQNVLVFDYSKNSSKDLVKFVFFQLFSVESIVKAGRYPVINYVYIKKAEKTISIDDGWYAGYDGLKTQIYQKVIDAFKTLGETITIDINIYNALVSFGSTTKDIIKYLKFLGGSGRFFGIYDDNEIDFTESFKSPNEADLFSDSTFNFLNISCPNLSSSGYIGESINILSFPCVVEYAQQILSQNINFSKNFPDNMNLPTIKFVLTNNKGQYILNNSPIKLTCMIDCYMKEESKLLK